MYLKAILFLVVFTLQLSVAAQGFMLPTPCNFETDLPLHPIEITYNEVTCNLQFSNGIEIALNGARVLTGKKSLDGSVEFEVTPITNDYLTEINSESCVLFAEHVGLLRQRLGEAGLTRWYSKIWSADELSTIVGKIEAKYAAEVRKLLSTESSAIGSPTINPCDETPYITFDEDYVYFDFPCNAYRALILHVSIQGSTAQHQEYILDGGFRNQHIPRDVIHTQKGLLKIRVLGQEYGRYAPLREFGWVKEGETR